MALPDPAMIASLEFLCLLFAGSGDLSARIVELRPGDTLQLASGDYPHLTIAKLNGRPDAWITIAGPKEGAPARIVADAEHNSIELVDSSYVAIENLLVDGKDLPGAFGVSAKGGLGNRVHDIRIENCTFEHHSGSQQQVAISTKTPTWGWIIRGNRILDAGTGMYLGNSNGEDPFVAGTIEGNLVQHTLGYSIEIKFQRARPAQAGLPEGPSTTTIRDNVLAKDERASPDGDRPNLLVGGFPDSGPGALDRYEICANLFLQNPRESLLQASGRVRIHDNVFAGSGPCAILLADHDLPLREAQVWCNTIYGVATGIRFGSPAREADALIGNLVFAATPFAGPIALERENLVDSVAHAGRHVRAPSLVPGKMDFHPLERACQGAALELELCDFDGIRSERCTRRGAYALPGGDGAFQLDLERKPIPARKP
jgi:hypothetical protein